MQHFSSDFVSPRPPPPVIGIHEKIVGSRPGNSGHLANRSGTLSRGRSNRIPIRCRDHCNSRILFSPLLFEVDMA